MNHKISVREVRDWVLELYRESERAITPAERREQHKYDTLIRHRQDKVFLSKMLDETSQIRDRRKLARRIKLLVERYGVPRFLNRRDRFLFDMYRAFGYHFDFIAIPIIKRRLRKETAAVIIDEARPNLTRHLASRFDQKIGQNVNLLGEVVLGNREADNRFNHYLEALESPDINYISVKISGIYAQTHALNYNESYPELVERISSLYRKAIENPYTDEYGNRRPKFINLDMEEYKDTHLTMRVFKTALSKPEFRDYTAGIVIQAYMPDAWDLQTELLEFARERVAGGGAPVNMRLVKGANLEMESVVSSLRGWPNPIFPVKTEVDANYLKILDRALLPENAKVVNVGVASHNFFTIGYAYLTGQRNGTSQYMTFEMLEGMANHIWRAQSALGNHVILYTPVVKDEHFLNAVSYLVRRLDENTGPDNFLSHSFDLRPDTQAWNFLEKQFEEACALKDSLRTGPFRMQDRTAPYIPVAPADMMANEPDTYFDLAANQKWAESIVDQWKKPDGHTPEVIPLQIGAGTVETDSRVDYRDRCQDDRVVVYQMCRADAQQVGEILEIADADPAGWRESTLDDRHRILYHTANNLARMRGDLIGCMCAVTGKTITEGDVEVSEAVDYARFYSTAMREFAQLQGVRYRPKGTVLVISPWNFPCAIPVGGITAALAGGNTVILKPATVAAPVAWMFAQAFWEAGVPPEALQVVITDREALRVLNTSPVIKHTILTGGTDTARAIIKANPVTPLSAETGGKNAIILTASGDRDHAILNAVWSAFGNAGQKCSACSLLLVEASVYDDPVFKEKLADAATSLKTGSIWEIGNIVGPMITNENHKLLEAISTLEEGEEWLIPPRFLDEKRYILAPTIKWGVRPGSFSFRNELFGPMLSVVRIKDLKEGIRLVNSLDYGLTSGLQSLDEAEQQLWRDSIQAGNLYINRGITGAIVNRQPFGGMKLSAFGGGIKAGGPNYCATLVHFTDRKDTDTDWRRNYSEAWQNEFSVARDINNLYGEQNVFRYLPLKNMALRLFPEDSTEHALRVVEAARLCRTPLTVSIDPSDERAGELEGTGVHVVSQTLEEFISTLPVYERIRTCSADIPRELYEAAGQHDLYIATAPPVCEGRVELIHYIKEQSITNEYHRYGSITEIPPVE
ncbi:MAG: bifunctional proline dehydrogenase/L-glutamate gamma-semialdehyde dehydrogenase [Alistipes sp.]|nr:bifunctional proline dehydrogenase/L-glutamate gamma-semialdehyde dehydrogenase [Alistipes sp.]